MSDPFQDRLNRIEVARTSIDMIGQGNKRDMVPLPTPPAAKTFDQRFRRSVLLNGSFGFFWMLPTAWLMTDPPLMHDILANWYETAAEASYTAQMLWYGAMGSFLLYIGYTRTTYAVTQRSDRSIGFTALWIGGIAGIILGFVAAYGVDGFIEELRKGRFDN